MSKMFFNTALAFLLVGAGVFLLLINLGILPLDMLEVWEYFYPLVFMALGGKWIIDGFSSRGRRRRRGHDRSHGWFWGLAFLTVGTLLLLNKLEIIVFNLRMTWQLWPLLLIYLGISIISGHSRKITWSMEDEYTDDYQTRGKTESCRREKTTDSGGPSHGSSRSEWQDSQNNCRGGANFIRSIKYDKPNWTVDPMDIWQGVGDYHFDFSRAYIPEKETLIKLSGWVGDIDIFLPGDVAFKVDAQANVGDMHVLGQKQDGLNPYVHYKSLDYDEAARKLAFEFDFKVLDLHIERV